MRNILIWGGNERWRGSGGVLIWESRCHLETLRVIPRVPGAPRSKPTGRLRFEAIYKPSNLRGLNFIK
jgi:hypothetical protein